MSRHALVLATPDPDACPGHVAPPPIETSGEGLSFLFEIVFFLEVEGFLCGIDVEDCLNASLCVTTLLKQEMFVSLPKKLDMIIQEDLRAMSVRCAHDTLILNIEALHPGNNPKNACGFVFRAATYLFLWFGGEE